MSDSTGANAPSFGEQVQSLGVVKTFSVALPAICRQYKVEVGLIFQSAGDGVGIGFSMPPKTPAKVEAAISQEVLRRLKLVERLLEIETIVAEFRRVGVAEDEIGRLIEEGEGLARQLHPEHGPTDL